jgi:hypothetical protein
MHMSYMKNTDSQNASACQNECKSRLHIFHHPENSIIVEKMLKVGGVECPICQKILIHGK